MFESNQSDSKSTKRDLLLVLVVLEAVGSKPGSSYCALQCLASSKALQIFDHAICQLAFAPESPQHEKKSPGTQCQESRHGMKAVLGASYAEQSWTSKVVWQNRAAPPALRSAQHDWPQQNQQAQTTPDLRQAHTLPAARGHRKARIRRTATVAPERSAAATKQLRAALIRRPHRNFGHADLSGPQPATTSAGPGQGAQGGPWCARARRCTASTGPRISPCPAARAQTISSKFVTDEPGGPELEERIP